MALFIIGHPCHSPRIRPLFQIGVINSLSSLLFLSCLGILIRTSDSGFPHLLFLTSRINHFSVRIYILFSVLLSVYGKDCNNRVYFV